MMYPDPHSEADVDGDPVDHTMPTIEITDDSVNAPYRDVVDSNDTDSTGSSPDNSVENGGEDGLFDPVSIKSDPNMTLYSDPMVIEAAARKRRTDAEAKRELEKAKEQQPTTIGDVVSALQDKYEQMVRQYKYDVAHDSEAARYGYKFGPGPYSNNKMRKYGSYNDGDAQSSHQEQKNRRLLQIIWMGLTMSLMVMMIMSANAHVPVLRASQNATGALVPRDGDSAASASLHQYLDDDGVPPPPPPPLPIDSSIENDDDETGDDEYDDDDNEPDEEAKTTEDARSGTDLEDTAEEEEDDDDNAGDDEFDDDDIVGSEDNSTEETVDEMEADAVVGHHFHSKFIPGTAAPEVTEENDDNDDVLETNEEEVESELDLIRESVSHIESKDGGTIGDTDVEANKEEQDEVAIIRQDILAIQELDETLDEELEAEGDDITIEANEEYRLKVQAVEEKIGSIAASLHQKEAAEESEDDDFSDSSEDDAQNDHE